MTIVNACLVNQHSQVDYCYPSRKLLTIWKPSLWESSKGFPPPKRGRMPTWIVSISVITLYATVALQHAQLSTSWCCRARLKWSKGAFRYLSSESYSVFPLWLDVANSNSQFSIIRFGGRAKLTWLMDKYFQLCWYSPLLFRRWHKFHTK